jgi:hypothetical protein
MNNVEIAHAIKNVSGASMVDNEILEKAQKIIAGLHAGVDIQEFADLMWEYSATLSAKVATGVTYAILGSEKFDEMCDELMENEVDNFISEVEKWENN